MSSQVVPKVPTLGEAMLQAAVLAVIFAVVAEVAYRWRMKQIRRALVGLGAETPEPRPRPALVLLPSGPSFLQAKPEEVQ